jgi:hypothetical protein
VPQSVFVTISAGAGQCLCSIDRQLRRLALSENSFRERFSAHRLRPQLRRVPVLDGSAPRMPAMKAKQKQKREERPPRARQETTPKGTRTTEPQRVTTSRTKNNCPIRRRTHLILQQNDAHQRAMTCFKEAQCRDLLCRRRLFAVEKWTILNRFTPLREYYLKQWR